MKKFAAAMAAALSLAVLGLSGCAQSGAKTSAEASAENPMVLTLAHGLSETHTVHIAMTEFADKVRNGQTDESRSASFQTASWVPKMRTWSS